MDVTRDLIRGEGAGKGGQRQVSWGLPSPFGWNSIPSAAVAAEAHAPLQLPRFVRIWRGGGGIHSS